MATTFQRPDMDAIIAACDDVVFINNIRAQVGKPRWTLPDEKLTLPWLFSRGQRQRQFRGDLAPALIIQEGMSFSTQAREALKIA